MGNLISCGLGHSPAAHVVKIVHSNGLVDEFPRPVRVSELIVDYPDHFICHSNDLNIMHRTPALSDSEELELGQLYFLLPLRTHRSVLSESDAAALTAKAALARKERQKESHRKQVLPLAPRHFQMKQNGSTMQVTVSRELIARFLAGSRTASLSITSAPKLCDTPELQTVYTKHMVAKSCRSWRPRLETIEEGGHQVCW